MQVQVNTDSSIRGDERLEEFVREQCASKLARFRDQITRLEVHIRDVNSSSKGGSDDKQCMIEARLQGLKPTAVSHDAGIVKDAVNGALARLERALDSTLGKLRDTQR